MLILWLLLLANKPFTTYDLMVRAKRLQHLDPVTLRAEVQAVKAEKIQFKAGSASGWYIEGRFTHPPKVKVGETITAECWFDKVKDVGLELYLAECSLAK